MKGYLGRMRGGGVSPPRVGLKVIIWSWLGAFLGVGAVAGVSFNVLDGTDLVLLIGSFGASAVLIFGVIESPLAQPRNFVGGHIVSAVIGVLAYDIFGGILWLAAAMAVATAIAAMQATKTVHPPGGATALIAVIGSAQIHALGYLYVLLPVAAGSLLMLLVALAVNNIPKWRRYPTFWI